MHANFRYILDTDIRPVTPIRECRLYRKELLSDKLFVFRITVPNDAEVCLNGDHEIIDLSTPLYQLSPTILLKRDSGWRENPCLSGMWRAGKIKLAEIPAIMEQKGFVLTDKYFITQKQYAYLMNHYEALKDAKTLPCDREIDRLTKEGA